MKITTLIIAVLVSSATLFAANEKAPIAATTSISGQIFDKTTGEALAGVKIELNETVVYSDLDGNFKFTNVIPGNYKINSSLISYTSSSIEVDCTTNPKKLEIQLDNK